MADELYALNAAQRDGLNRLLGARPPAKPVGAGANDRQQPGVHVLCGEIHSDIGGYRYYFGTVQEFTTTPSGGGSPTHADPQGAKAGATADCWLVSRVDLVVGKPYPAIPSGSHTLTVGEDEEAEDSTRPVYVAEVRPFKWVKVLDPDNEPYCEEGTLVIPWIWAAVLDTGSDACDFMLPPPDCPPPSPPP